MNLKKLIDSIDLEVIELKKDANRGVKPLAERLIQLSKSYAESRRDYQKSKTSYDLDYIKAKEDREKELNKANEIIDDEKKKVKITDAELCRYAGSCLVEEYKKMMSYKEDEVYLAPIIEAYVNFMNAVKFDAKEVIAMENFLNSKGL